MMNFIEEIIWSIIFILHMPAGLVANLTHLLTLTLEKSLNLQYSDIVLTWLLYALAGKLFIFRKNYSIKRKRLLLIIFAVYILSMVLLVEHTINKGLNLTKSTPVLVLLPT